MIEIINVLFLLSFSSILLSNFFFINYFQKKIEIKKLSLMDIFSLNILIIVLVTLILSFFKLNLFVIFFLFFILAILSFVFYYNSKKNIEKNLIFDFLIFFIFCLILSADLVANLKLEWDGQGWYSCIKF